MSKERLILLVALSLLSLISVFTFAGAATTTSTIGTTTTSTSIATTCAPTTTTAEASIAQQIWNAMKGKGWNDNICAGILGNIMAECGGGTLDIKPFLHGDGKTSFGICQWHNERKTNMLNYNGKNYNTTTNLPTVEHQVDYLEYELALYNINIVNSDKNYKEVAYTFCVKFERPANKYEKAVYRQQLAEIAYQEFSLCE